MNKTKNEKGIALVGTILIIVAALAVGAGSSYLIVRHITNREAVQVEERIVPDQFKEGKLDIPTERIGVKNVVVEKDINLDLSVEGGLDIYVRWFDFTGVVGDKKIGILDTCWSSGHQNTYLVINLRIKNNLDSPKLLELERFSLYTLNPLTKEKDILRTSLAKDLINETDEPLLLTPISPGEERTGSIVLSVPITESGYKNLAKTGCSGDAMSDISREREVLIGYDGEGGISYQTLFKAENKVTIGKIGQELTNENMRWSVKLNSIEYLLKRQTRNSGVLIDIEIKNTGNIAKRPLFDYAGAMIPRVATFFFTYKSLGEEKSPEINHKQHRIENYKTAQQERPFLLTSINPGEKRAGQLVFDRAFDKRPFSRMMEADSCYLYVRDPQYKGAVKIEIPCPPDFD